MDQHTFDDMIQWISQQGVWLDMSEMQSFLEVYAEEHDLDIPMDFR